MYEYEVSDIRCLDERDVKDSQDQFYFPVQYTSIRGERFKARGRCQELGVLSISNSG